MHIGFRETFDKLKDMCKPKGSDVITTPTLLQWWFHTLLNTTSSRTSRLCCMLLDALVDDRDLHAREHISRDLPPLNKQCGYCEKLVGVCRNWHHMDCLTKDPTKVLKFHHTKQHGFFCSACCTAGYTFQGLCHHLTHQHSEADLIKLGVSSILVFRAGGPEHVKQSNALMAEAAKYFMVKRVEHGIQHCMRRSMLSENTVASTSPMQPAVLPAAPALRLILRTSPQPELELMRLIKLCPGWPTRVSQRFYSNHFMSHKLAGGNFCIFFPWSKFQRKAYPCGSALGLWQVAELKKQLLPHEGCLMNCDSSIGFLNVFQNDYLDPDSISMLVSQQEGTLTRDMFVAI